MKNLSVLNNFIRKVERVEPVRLYTYSFMGFQEGIKTYHLRFVNYLLNFLKIRLREILQYRINNLLYRSKHHLTATVNINDLVSFEMCVDPKDLGLSLELLLYGCHEPYTSYLLVMKSRYWNNIVDIGSNIGYYPLLEYHGARLNSPLILAIEPDPRSYFYLQLNLKNPEVFKITNVAVGREETDAYLLQSTRYNLSRLINIKQCDTHNKIIRVKIRHIKDVVKENLEDEKIDVIRMDLEGGEYNVLYDLFYSNILAKSKPYLVIEFHPLEIGKKRSLEVLRKLCSIGYEIEFVVRRMLDWPFLKFDNFSPVIYDLTLSQFTKIVNMLFEAQWRKSLPLIGPVFTLFLHI